jgi:hypothetical protein
VTVLRRATKDHCIRSVVVDPMTVRGEREGVGESPVPTFRVPNRETDSHQIWFLQLYSFIFVPFGSPAQYFINLHSKDWH